MRTYLSMSSAAVVTDALRVNHLSENNRNNSYHVTLAKRNLKQYFLFFHLIPVGNMIGGYILISKWNCLRFMSYLHVIVAEKFDRF